MILNKLCDHVIIVVENYGHPTGHLSQTCKYEKSRGVIFMDLERFSWFQDVPAHLDMYIMFLLQCFNTQQSETTVKESHLNKFINGLQRPVSVINEKVFSTWVTGNFPVSVSECICYWGVSCTWKLDNSKEKKYMLIKIKSHSAIIWTFYTTAYFFLSKEKNLFNKPTEQKGAIKYKLVRIANILALVQISKLFILTGAFVLEKTPFFKAK